MPFDQKLNPDQKYPAFQLLWSTCSNVNLMRDIPKWEIPVYIMHGDNDHFTETSLAKAYFDSLEAPIKKWFLFEMLLIPYSLSIQKNTAQFILMKY